MRGIAVSPEVTFDKLVEMTEGYSGADMANVCRDAAMMPLRRKIAEGGIDILQIQEHKGDIDVPLTIEDFKQALKNVSKSVSQGQLDEYKTWMAEFGAQ